MQEFARKYIASGRRVAYCLYEKDVNTWHKST